MSDTALHLKHSHFTALSIMLTPDFVRKDCLYDGPYPSSDGLDLEVDVALGRLKREQDNPEAPQFMVRVSVTGAPAEGRAFPYRFAACMEGVFYLDGEPPDDAERLVVINGASMLYGALREQFLTLTGRHKHGAMMLPSMSFRNYSPPEEAAAPE